MRMDVYRSLLDRHRRDREVYARLGDDLLPPPAAGEVRCSCCATLGRHPVPSGVPRSPDPLGQFAWDPCGPCAGTGILPPLRPIEAYPHAYRHACGAIAMRTTSLVTEGAPAPSASDYVDAEGDRLWICVDRPPCGACGAPLRMGELVLEDASRAAG